MFSLDRQRECLRVVETQDVLAIVDEQIEVLEKILAQDASDARVRRLEFFEIVYGDQSVRDRMHSGLDKIEIGERTASVGRHATDAGSATGFQMEFGSQGGVDTADLSTRVDDEVIGPGVVDPDGDNY
jgi:hypothetical protein